MVAAEAYLQKLQTLVMAVVVAARAQLELLLFKITQVLAAQDLPQLLQDLL
jgi:hypothetical protein